MLKYSRNEQGAVLVTTVVFAFVISLLGVSYFRLGGLEGGLVHNRLSASQALYCADAGVEYARFRLSDENQWVNSDWGSISVGSIGATELQFIYSNGATEGTLISTGTVGNVSRMIQAVINKAIAGEPDGLLTLGNVSGGPYNFDLDSGVNIDGRNHDADGNLVLDGSGTVGLNISEGVTITGSGYTIGGTLDGTDYAPLDPNDPGFNPDLIQQSSGGPSSPYEALGFDSDAGLIQDAQEPGNTYYNVAAMGGPPTGAIEVSGLTYIDFAGYDQKWVDDAASITGDGILIIRGGVDKFKMAGMSVDFKGVFIGDNLEFEPSSGRILGAVTAFSPTNKFEISGPTDILYSREVMLEAFYGSGIFPAFGSSGGFEPALASWREL